MTDEELMAKVTAEACQESFNALYRKYHATMIAICFRKIDDIPDAEEVVNNCFLYLWKRPDLFDASKGKFFNWFYTLVARRSIDCVRKRATATKVKDKLIQEEPVTLPLIGFITQLELSEIIEKSRLTNQQKQAFMLVHHEGCNHREAAQRMVLNKSTLRIHLINAVDKIRNYLSTPPRSNK